MDEAVKVSGEAQATADAAHTKTTPKGPAAANRLLWNPFAGKLHFGAPAFGYACALALVFLVGFARIAISGTGPMWGPLLFFYFAGALSAYLGGLGPGLFAAVASATFAAVLFPHWPSTLHWITFGIASPMVVTVFAHLRFLRERTVELERECARFRFISDFAIDWIFLLETSGGRHGVEGIRFVNQTACLQLGWEAEALIGRDLSTLVRPSESVRLRAILAQTRYADSQTCEFSFQRMDGSELRVEVACSGVEMGDGFVIHVIGRDISERIRNEQRLREAKQWESLGSLAGGLAHDFNNLLTTIMGNASLAKELLPAEHRVIPMLDSALDASERSAELVHLLLASSGYVTRQDEDVSMDCLISTLINSGKLPPAVRFCVNAEKVVMRCDAKALGIVVYNLMANAAEAYKDRLTNSYGEAPIVMATVATETCPPFAESAAPAAEQGIFLEGEIPLGKTLVITVEDEGCGMSQEVLDRAFEPFYSTKFTGRGLGLAAVRGIVRAGRGQIRLRTAQGEGTRVEIRMPMDRVS